MLRSKLNHVSKRGYWMAPTTSLSRNIRITYNVPLYTEHKDEMTFKIINIKKNHYTGWLWYIHGTEHGKGNSLDISCVNCSGNSHLTERKKIHSSFWLTAWRMLITGYSDSILDASSERIFTLNGSKADCHIEGVHRIKIMIFAKCCLLFLKLLVIT